MIVSRCAKALRSGARPELLQTGPCSSRLGWGFFKFLNLDNTRISLKRFRVRAQASLGTRNNNCGTRNVSPYKIV